MILLGITGGVGMGKSTSSAILERAGVPVVDTDVVAREVVAPGSPALAEIRAAFGSEMIAADGGLDRARMADIAFGDPAARARLEAILHPRIRESWQQTVHGWRESGRPCAAVVIPLLFETRAESLFDAVVCVACGAVSQRRRLRERGWDDSHIDRRLAAQMPIERKMIRSRFVIWTEPPVAVHEEQVRRVLRDVRVGPD